MSDLSAAGETHVGQVRRGNEDALLVGSSVFAVADGMGGHVAGEVASETALGPVADLDGRIYADPGEALEALRDAVSRANEHVLERADEEPDLRGMGTTLTAALVEHRRLHLAHVGDSRAYLLRDGELSQLTRDHTVVQGLLDDDQITPEEAASHPKRSIITRAIGVSSDLDVDARTLTLQAGDRLLLCSDGLTNVIDDDELATELARAGELQEAIDRLIDRANERGGPDNITALALAFDDDRIGESAGRTTGELTPVSDPGAVQVTTREETDTDDWARRLGRVGHFGRPRGAPTAAGEEAEAGPSRLQRVGAIVLGLLVLAGMVLGGGRWLLGRSYYVGLAGERVAIYQGIPSPERLGPLDLSWVHERTDVTVREVPDLFAQRLEDGILAADAADAQRIIDNAAAQQSAAGGTDQPDPGASPAPGTTPPPDGGSGS